MNVHTVCSLTAEANRAGWGCTRYGRKKWRPTAVYSLLWLSSILYAFSVLICVSCKTRYPPAAHRPAAD